MPVGGSDRGAARVCLALLHEVRPHGTLGSDPGVRQVAHYCLILIHRSDSQIICFGRKCIER
jgi:hypothetical protein